MIGVGLIARQVGGGEDRAEKQPGAELTRDEVGMLSLPAEARRLRQRLFHHRRGIDKYLDLATGFVEQPSRQRLQPLLDQVVIVVAARINRDRAAGALLQHGERIFVGSVVDAQHDHRADGRP
jgi:hypothetical protein